MVGKIDFKGGGESVAKGRFWVWGQFMGGQFFQKTAPNFRKFMFLGDFLRTWPLNPNGTFLGMFLEARASKKNVCKNRLKTAFSDTFVNRPHK